MRLVRSLPEFLFRLNAAVNAALILWGRRRGEVGAAFPRLHASPAFGLSFPYPGKTERRRSETAEDQREEEVSRLPVEEVKSKGSGRVKVYSQKHRPPSESRFYKMNDVHHQS